MFHNGPPLTDINGHEIIAEGPLQLADTLHNAVVYPGFKGSWVFNAGTIWWAERLSQPPGCEHRLH